MILSSLTKYVKIDPIINLIFVEISKKSGIYNIFGPNLGFSTKKGFKIRDPQISWFPFGTKNHEMRGHPVAFFSKKKIIPQTTLVPTFWPHIISELGGVKNLEIDKTKTTPKGLP